jgi:hypothetical protein
VRIALVIVSFCLLATALLTPTVLAEPDPAPVMAALAVDQPPVPPLTVSGIATWYDAERNGQTAWYTREGIAFYGAAGPALRELRPHRYLERYRILLTSERTGRTVLVWVVDWCSCAGAGSPRLIDLAPTVWDALGVPLSRGITPITIEFLD